MECLYRSGYKTVWATGLELKQVRPQAGEGLEAKQVLSQARSQARPRIDGDGLPFCSLHWQMCFPDGFCTPWNYVSQNVIDCTPIEHLNHRGSSSKVLAVPVFTVHAHDEQGLN
jgi:hypothetical protein